MSRNVIPALFLVAAGLFLVAAVISAQNGGPINYVYVGLGLGLFVVGVAKLRKSSRT